MRVYTTYVKNGFTNSYGIVVIDEKRNGEKKVLCRCHCQKEFLCKFVGVKKKKSCGCYVWYRDSPELLHRSGTLEKDGFKKCSSCKQNKTKKDFSLNEKAKDKLSCSCKECHYYNSIKKLFGLTKEQYNSILEKQNHQCPCCLKHIDDNWKRFSVDHCHKTNKVRGILCNNCNMAIARLGDNSQGIKNAMNYLEKTNEG